MKKDDLIILIVALLLLAGMLYTILFGGEESRHGVGFHDSLPPKNIQLDLCQSRSQTPDVI